MLRRVAVSAEVAVHDRRVDKRLRQEGMRLCAALVVVKRFETLFAPKRWILIRQFVVPRLPLGGVELTDLTNHPSGIGLVRQEWVVVWVLRVVEVDQTNVHEHYQMFTVVSVLKEVRVPQDRLHIFHQNIYPVVLLAALDWDQF